MNKAKKIGIIVILLGILITSVLYPFTKPDKEALRTKALFASKGVNYSYRINELDVRHNSYIFINKIHYEYVVAISIILIIFGTGLVILSPRKEHN